MASAARTRILKKPAEHNHRSSRTRAPSDMASTLPAGYGPRAAPGMRILGTAAPPKPFFVQSTMLARCARSEEHTSELQSPCNLVCRLLLEKKKQRQLKQATEVRKPELQRPQRTSRCVALH